MSTQIEQNRGHVLMLSEAINTLLRENNEKGDWPFDLFVIRRNWYQDDRRISMMHDIFEKYDTAYRNNEPVTWHDLEAELKKTFNWDYTVVKQLILALWDSNLWKDVCTEYAKTHECSEFTRILHPERRR